MKPVSCCLGITNTCMLKCKMCYIWKETSSYPASWEPGLVDWKRFITSLRKLAEGEFRINFAAGEVLMSNITLELISYASSLGFDTLINTNAYLINEETAKKIHKSGLKHVYISLDSLNAATHDYLRGIEGVYARVMNAIEYLYTYSKNTNIHINAVILEDNLDDIVNLSKWVIQDQRLSSVHFQAVTQPFSAKPEYKWHEKNEYSFLWPKDIKKTENIIDELIRFKGEYGIKVDNSISQFRMFKAYFNNPQDFIKKTGCHMSKYSINVSASGEIFICFDMGPIGRITQEGLDVEELWYSPQADLVRQQINNCKRNCLWLVNCNYDEAEQYIG